VEYGPAGLTARLDRSASREAGKAPYAGNAVLADPYRSATDRVSGPGISQPALLYGVVVDAVMGGHAYRVSSGESGFIWCGLTGLGALGPFGQKPVDTVAIGQAVFYVIRPETPTIGTIVALAPGPGIGQEDTPGDAAWPFFRSGHSGDVSHRIPVEEAIALAEAAGLPGGIDVWDFSSGRTLDATATGERGFLAETGVGIVADSFHVQMRVDEHTGVFAFYHDQLLRIAGVNFQQWTSLSDDEQVDDAGELYGVKRTWVYPWEGAGLWKWNQVTGRSTDNPVVDPDTGVENDNPDVNGIPGYSGQGSRDIASEDAQGGNGLAVRETADTGALPAARGYEFSGYLGQGTRTVTALPLQFTYVAPEAVEWTNKGAGYFSPNELEDGATTPADTHLFFDSEGVAEETVGEPNDPVEARVEQNRLNNVDGFQPGVISEHRTMAGAYHLAAAKRIILVKRSSQPVPRQKRKPEDPGGDEATPPDDSLNPTPYTPSGLSPPSGYVGTAADWSRHKVQADLPDMGEGRRANAVADLLAYVFNWEASHPFSYHLGDWDLPEEGLAGSPLVNQAIPAYARLACRQHLKDPPAVSLDVDHRYGPTDYYQTESVIALLDDGDVLIYTGFGASIHLHNADVNIDTPGDINLRSGRNINMWAGHDVTIKARDSVDLAATKHDIRLSSARNLQAVAGFSGCGGILLESQAVCPGYQFTDSVGEEVKSSGIVMVAPNSQVLAISRDVVLTSLGGKIICDAGPTGTVRSISRYHHIVAYCSIVAGFGGRGGQSGVNEFSAGYTLIGSALSVNGSVSAIGSVGTAALSVSTGITARDYGLRTYMDSVLDVPSAPIEAYVAEFTMRSDEQMLTYDFTAWRPRWMTLAAESGQALTTWSESPVVASASGYSQHPYPGGAWTEPGSMRWSSPFLTNPERGWVARSRNPQSFDTSVAAYETLTPGDVVESSLADSWVSVIPDDSAYDYCNYYGTPPAIPGTFTAGLVGGWGWPDQLPEESISTSVTNGYWSAPPPPPPPPPPLG